MWPAVRLLELRQGDLTQMNTQAALVASCAVGLLCSSELEIVKTDTVCLSSSFLPCTAFEYVLNITYIIFALLSLLLSLSTMVLSNHLIHMTIRVLVEGTNDDGMKLLEQKLTTKMDLATRAGPQECPRRLAAVAARSHVSRALRCLPLARRWRVDSQRASTALSSRS